MVKKATPLTDAVAQNMDGRSIAAPSVEKDTQQATEASQNTTPVTPSPTKGYKKNIVSIRFDEGDYERLNAIALEQGTNAPSLIRKAVKEIIKSNVTL
jgi:argininosuccinate synthase